MDSFNFSQFFGTSYCQNLDYVQQESIWERKKQLGKTLKNHLKTIPFWNMFEDE